MGNAPILSTHLNAGVELPSHDQTLWSTIYCSGSDPYSPLQVKQGRLKPILVPSTEKGKGLVPLELRLYHHFIGDPKEEHLGIQFSSHPTPRSCGCPPGLHARFSRLLLTNEVTIPGTHRHLVLPVRPFEVGDGGGRGSGKSEHTNHAIVRGNPIREGIPQHMHDLSYVHHPQYQVLVVRKNQLDLQQMFQRHRDFLSKFLRIPIGRLKSGEHPTMHITFPAGGRITYGHADNVNDLQKYLSQQYHTIVIEQVEQLPYDVYWELTKVCRSGTPELHAMIFANCNPGGPGSRWFRDRFPRAKNRKGEFIAYEAPILDAKTGKVRVYFHSTVDDNPYTLRTGYDRTLDGAPTETSYKRDRKGDWDAVEGQFFAEFRSKRYENEPEWAQHEVTGTGESAIENWFPIIAGFDYGYGHYASFVAGRARPEGRFQFTHNQYAKGVTALEWGQRIAEFALEQYRDGYRGMIPVGTSQEIFGDPKAPRAIIHQIVEGVRQVFGTSKTISAACDVVGGTQEQENAYWRQPITEELRLVFVKARPNRSAEWAYCRELLRWRTKENKSANFDDEYFLKLWDQNPREAEEYAEWWNREREVLPKMWINNNLRMLVDSILAAIESEKDSEDVEKLETLEDDVLDSWRYCCRLYGNIKVVAPLEVLIRREFEKREPQTYLEKAWIQDYIRERYGDERGLDPFSIDIPSGRIYTSTTNNTLVQ